MDDEPSFRDMLCNILKPLGLSILTAETGREAIDIVLASKPDIAILDMRLPDMDGLDVLTSIMRINPDTKCIIVSGSCSQETAIKTIELGALYYINKPFKFEEVLQAVEAAIKAIPAKKRLMPKIALPLPSPAFMRIVTRIGLAAAACAVLGGIAHFGMKYIAQHATAEEYSISYANPAGMCWIGSDLWVSDWVSGNIYCHKKDWKNKKFTIDSVHKTYNPQPTGLTFDGRDVWSCNPVEKKIYRHRVASPGDIVASLDIPGVNASGLYADGADLWITDTEAGKIFKYKTNMGSSSVETFESPTRNPCGIFKEGNYFYIGDYRTGRIYKASSGNFAAIVVYEIPGFEQGKDKLAGLAWDGETVWLCYDGIPKIFCYRLEELKARSLI
jgi:CheY-like chemotaxis protein/sugar lactone lactonase YvrE